MKLNKAIEELNEKGFDVEQLFYNNRIRVPNKDRIGGTMTGYQWCQFYNILRKNKLDYTITSYDEDFEYFNITLLEIEKTIKK